MIDDPLDKALFEHSIAGVEYGRQGAAQVVPEDVVLCMSCGWHRLSDYHRHLVGVLREAGFIPRSVVEGLVSALERTEANFISAVNSRPVRDMAENLAENRSALAAVIEETP